MVLVVIEQEGDLGAWTSSSASSSYQQTYGPQLVDSKESFTQIKGECESDVKISLMFVNVCDIVFMFAGIWSRGPFAHSECYIFFASISPKWTFDSKQKLRFTFAFTIGIAIAYS